MKTSFAKAIQIWEEKNEQNASDAEVIKLNFTIPPIDKLEAAILSTLTNCVQLSLSTNCIEKMVTISGLKKLQVLSLGRNQIKKIYGLEEVGANLKELWISYNLIEKLDGLAPHCTELETFYIAHNKIKDFIELDKIKDLPNLKNCVFLGNEIYDKYENPTQGRLRVLKKIEKLTMIDNILVTEKDRENLDENQN